MKHVKSIMQKHALGLSVGHSLLSGRQMLTISSGSMACVSSLTECMKSGWILN